MTWKKIVLLGAAIVTAAIIVALIGGYFYLQSNSFRQFALRKIVEQIHQSTGGRAEIGNLDFQISTLTAHADNIVIHGNEPSSTPPLLAVDRLTVSFKVQSIFKREVYLSELLIEHPVVRVQVDRTGNSNLPQPKEQTNSSGSQTNLFDLGVKHAAITQGEISYNDHKVPLAADLQDLHTEISFDNLGRRYSGSIAYRAGTLRYADDQPLNHSLEAAFTATPTEFDLNSTTMQVASSTIKLRAALTNYAAPLVDGTYDILVHTQDARKVNPSLDVTGDVNLTGKFHYQLIDGQPFLRSVVVDGSIASEAIAARSSGNRIELRKLHGQFQLANGSLRASDLVADAYNGRISAEANLNHLDTTSSGQAKVRVVNISLLAVQHSLSQMRSERVAAAGNLDGIAEASWTATPTNALVRADLSIKHPGAAGSGNAPIVPVDGAIHAIYDGRTRVLTLKQSTLRIPSTTITADGEVSNRSSLKIHASTEDLHQAVEFASSFSAAKSPPPVIGGAASIDATITGSTSQPAISGNLQAHNLEVQGSQWESVALSVRANPNHVTISDGSVVAMHNGRVTFSADAALHNWTYPPSSPIHASLTASQMRIADLQQAAGTRYPVSGEISAKISLRGSQLDPHGSGTIEIADARAGDEPLKTVKVTFLAQNGSVTSQMRVVSDAGSTNAALEYTPKTKAYKVNLDAPQIVIQKLRTAQEKNLAINGSVTLHANGEGTLDNPQLNASIVIPKLEVKDKSVAGIKAQLQVANRRADFSLDSEISQASLKARGQVDLTGDYQTEAAIDSSVIPLDTLLATYASGVPEGFSGQAELHASLKGPLKDRSQLRAHLEVPKLEARYQSLEVGLAQPLRADFANSVISFDPTEIRGTGTSIRLQGKVPLAGSSVASLTAQGSIDAKIFRLLVPDVRSSGTINLDIRATGSASEPQVDGEVRLQNVAVATPSAPLSIDKLNGVLNLDNEKVRISEMKAQVGGGQVSLGGTIGYRGPKEFDLALQASSLRLRYPEGLRSMLDANLTWTGDIDDSTLRGTVLIDGLSFTPDFDLASFGDQFSGGTTVPAAPGFADNVNLQVRVQSKDNLSATSSQVSLEGSAALNVGGTAANPVITGRTDLTSGELFYRNVRYQLQRGIITFSDPNETRPNLDVSVTTTVEQYNLTLNLRGAFDTLTTSYSSDPPLSTADIINLIARGKTSSELAASSQSTDSMIASQAASQVSGSVQKLVGISSLTIDPTIGGNNQNPSARVAVQQRVTKNFLFTFSTDITQPGEEIVQGEYQINKRWSVSVARDQLGGISVDGRFHTKF